MTSYRLGIPTTSQIRAHETIHPRKGRFGGGQWQVLSATGISAGKPYNVWLSVDGLRGQKIKEGRPVIANGLSFWQDFGKCLWAADAQFKPLDTEGKAVPWPTESACLVANEEDADQRVNRDDERIVQRMQDASSEEEVDAVLEEEANRILRRCF